MTKKTYFIHSNGSRPFKVVHEPKNKKLTVFSVKLNSPGNEDDYIDEPVLTSTYSVVFIGKSNKNKQTEYSGGFGPQFNGNTILFKKETETGFEYVCELKFDGSSVSLIYENGELVRTMLFERVERISGRWVPMRMLVQPADKPDEMTELVYDSLEFDVKLDANLFSLQSLRRR